MITKSFEKASEQTLVAAAQAGDNEAFNILMRRHQGHLYRMMVQACRHPQDAEDVVGDAFTRAYEKLSQFEGRSSFITWLGRIASNLCTRKREKLTLPAYSLEEMDEPDSPRHSSVPADMAVGPEQAAIQNELQSAIYEAISALPPLDRTILQLRDMDQLSIGEIGKQTSLTMPAVKARLHRARACVRERLNSRFLDSL